MQGTALRMKRWEALIDRVADSLHHQLMVTTWSAVVPALGAVVAALGGVFVGGRLTARSQHSSWLRDCQLKAVAEALDAYTLIYEQLLSWCIRGERADIDWPGWNSILVKLSLTAHPEVARAAFRLDGELWRIDERAKAGKVGLAAWLEVRNNLESLHLTLVNAARAQLNPDLTALESATGRPDQADPMWESWRSRHPEIQDM